MVFTVERRACSSGESAAYYQQRVGQGHGCSHGIAGSCSEDAETFAGGLGIALALAVGYVADIFGREALRSGGFKAGVLAYDGAYGHIVFGHNRIVDRRRYAEGFNAGVVAQVQTAVDDFAYAETGAEGIAQQVAVHPRAAQCG